MGRGGKERTRARWGCLSHQNSKSFNGCRSSSEEHARLCLKFPRMKRQYYDKRSTGIGVRIPGFKMWLRVRRGM